MPTCLIVTAYYRFPSKHSSHSYDEWMKNFLTTIDNPLLVFCEEESVAKITQWRAAFPTKTWIFVLPFRNLHCQKIDWQKDWKRDVEQKIHNPNLYIIWNEKAAFLHRAMLLHAQYDFYMWCDIGCFRSAAEMDLFRGEWPSQSFLAKADKNKMYFLNIEPFQAGELELLPHGLTRSFENVNRIGGTIFLGSKAACENWVLVYYDYLQKYIDHDYFAGKDQNILASIYAAHPELFHLVTPKAGEGNPWFYLQRYFL